MSAPFGIATDPRFGYRRLDPLPTEAELEAFYRDKYYGLIAAGGRAPEIMRQMQGGAESAAELEWLGKTLWADIRAVLDALLPGETNRAVLDIGCGPGVFLRAMQEAGWRPTGVEPSQEAGARAREAGLELFGSVEAALAAGRKSFEAVTLLNVLEHVRDPIAVIGSARTALRQGGILVVRVPNDFSALQEIARARTGKPAWWVAPPDHIHYFDFPSLEKTIESCGFQVAERLADFPMELFLLMGDDYVGNSEVGRACHQRRRALELALPAERRRRLYRGFAAEGMGRNALVFARAM
jgi:2-polyprenyl-3-methyl-5-hydroxy-6-metoxy-1,4-benzoquinol methylase